MFYSGCRQISNDQGEQKAKELDVNYTEVSAKTGGNVNELFKMISMNLTGNEPSHLGVPATNGATPQGNENTAGNLIKKNPLGCLNFLGA